MSRKEVIEKFLKERGANVVDSTVTEMRRIIPLLMMVVYCCIPGVKKGT